LEPVPLVLEAASLYRRARFLAALEEMFVCLEVKEVVLGVPS